MSFYADDWLTVHLGDCRTVMAGLEPESVHCVVTSPPYWGLRDYGTASWEGGDEGCDHKPEAAAVQRAGVDGSTLGGGKGTQAEAWMSPKKLGMGDTCRKCGARRIDQQLGLEPTPEAYVESMVAVFREVRRVLRSDGTVWLNLGDSYASHDPGGYRQGEHLNPGGRQAAKGSGRNRAGVYRPAGLKPKDLVGIPWRVAFALQADGWYLRSDIIWSKPNPMPESVTDRPTKSHEYIFLLSKSPRYYFDADAVREAHVGPLHAPGNRFDPAKVAGPMDRGGASQWERDMTETWGNPAGRNIRSVWTVATQPYPGAHFATFPPKLIEPCILAGCPDKVCPECGAPWERVVERTPTTSQQKSWANGEHVQVSKGLSRPGRFVDGHAETVGWRSTCQCGDPANRASRPSGVAKAAAGSPTVPGTVLDPFAGSGTTAMVANRLSRRAVLIDLNADYLGQVMDRNRELPLGLVG